MKKKILMALGAIALLSGSAFAATPNTTTSGNSVGFNGTSTSFPLYFADDDDELQPIFISRGYSLDELTDMVEGAQEAYLDANGYYHIKKDGKWYIYAWSANSQMYYCVYVNKKDKTNITV